MLRDFWQWWIDGLSGPWPVGLRRWLRGRRRTVWAADAGEDLEFLVCRKGTWKPIWKGAPTSAMPAAVRRRLRAADVVVRMAGHSVLKRSVTIPPESSPSEHIRRRLAEFSPFPGDQTWFDAVVEPAGSNAVLVMARRDDVESRLRELREAGLHARAVTAEDFEHTALNLMPDDRSTPARRDLTGAIVLLAGLVACGAALAAPFMQQSRLIQELKAEQSRLERRLARGDDTRERIHRLQTRAALISAHVASKQDIVALVTDVTRATPDHSWVRQLVLHEGTLTLNGESEDMADLITRLEAAPGLSNVRYDAPVTRNAESGTDRFKLSAEISTDGL